MLLNLYVTNWNWTLSTACALKVLLVLHGKTYAYLNATLKNISKI